MSEEHEVCRRVICWVIDSTSKKYKLTVGGASVEEIQRQYPADIAIDSAGKDHPVMLSHIAQDYVYDEENGTWSCSKDDSEYEAEAKVTRKLWLQSKISRLTVDKSHATVAGFTELETQLTTAIEAHQLELDGLA